MVNGAGQRSQGSFCHFPQGPQMSTMLQGSHCHTHINGRKSGGWTLAGVLPFSRGGKTGSGAPQYTSCSISLARMHPSAWSRLRVILEGGAATSSLTLLPTSIVGSQGCYRVLFQEIWGTAECRANLGDYSFQEAIDKKCPPGLCF